MYLLDRIRLSH